MSSCAIAKPTNRCVTTPITVHDVCYSRRNTVPSSRRGKRYGASCALADRISIKQRVSPRLNWIRRGGIDKRKQKRRTRDSPLRLRCPRIGLNAPAWSRYHGSVIGICKQTIFDIITCLQDRLNIIDLCSQFPPKRKPSARRLR